ncbi:MAG: YdcF family protein [Cyclobacteriaceae bacterium]|nr:YdcF family protein [Cyclobacteriaceae bacterium]
MFFVLSKTLSYLLKPLVIICGLLICSWLIKNSRWNKRLLITSIILLLFFSNDFIANEAMRSWEVSVTPFSQIEKKYEYGVLLCGVAKSEVGPDDRVYIGSAADRVNHTLQLYKMGFIKKILISGGSGRLIDIGEREADKLSSLLQLMGVPAQDIMIENQSRNTHESAIEIKKILAPFTTADQCLLITSAFHIRRSIGCFSKVGWPMDSFSADVLSHNRNFSFDTLFIPKTEAMGSWNVLLKEWAGYIAYRIAGYI